MITRAKNNTKKQTNKKEIKTTGQSEPQDKWQKQRYTDKITQSSIHIHTHKKRKRKNIYIKKKKEESNQINKQIYQ